MYEKVIHEKITMKNGTVYERTRRFPVYCDEERAAARNVGGSFEEAIRAERNRNLRAMPSAWMSDIMDAYNEYLESLKF